MAYDRAIVVNCIKRYYDLLIEAAYLDPASIRYPLDHGWTDEQLVVDILHVLGRSEEVIDLLRHLPYIQQPPDVDKYEVYEETVPASYLRGTDIVENLTAEECQGKSISDLLLMPLSADWPTGFISLSHGRDATWWVIDTTEGIVYPVGTDFIDDAPEDQPWLEASVPRDIQEYFDEILDEIKSLKMVPCPKGEASWFSQILPCEHDKGRVVRRVLEKHGWPDNFDRDEYLKELREVHPDNGSECSDSWEEDCGDLTDGSENEPQIL
ncbi:hypothetical protein GQ44DRAFT_658968 [Phaeosphaeriaceae sp. PMI808]|nr:hypothetical protein GQ44DRAFT_658968 [Phaeosphaeriaceae sp. PMI808]